MSHGLPPKIDTAAADLEFSDHPVGRNVAVLVDVLGQTYVIIPPGEVATFCEMAALRDRVVELGRLAERPTTARLDQWPN